MQFVDTFQLNDFLDTLLVAFVLGTLIGAERQYRQRSAGELSKVPGVSHAIWTVSALE